MGKKVYLDPEALQRRVDAFKEIATKAKDEVGKIINVSSEQNDPMENPPIETYTPKMRETAIAVDERLAEIEECKKTIERLSSNGIGTKVGDYGIELEIPDDRIDSKGKLESWAKAAVDGKDLESLADSDGKEPLPSGRSYHELLKSLRENKGSKKNPHYANFLIDEVGPENLAKIPVAFQTHVGGGSAYGNEKAHEIANLLGQNLGIASTQWDRKRSKAVADGIVKSVTGKGKWGRITALNAMLKMRDKDNKYRNSLAFGKDFLLSLGEGLEKLPLDKIKQAFKADENLTGPQHVWAPGRRNNAGPFLAASTTSHGPTSMDPMAGVLDAMGNNRDAALDFLSPASGNMERVARLSERDWDQEGMAGLAGALGAASSNRNSEDPDIRVRADRLAGHALRRLAENTEESVYNDETKARLGVLFGNCAPEIVGLAQGAGGSDPKKGRLPEARSEDIETMLFRVADSRDAMATIGAAVGTHTRERGLEAVRNSSTFNEKAEALDQEYEYGVTAAGYLNGLADEKARIKTENADKDHEEAKAAAKSSFQAFATAAGIGLSAVAGPVGTAMGSSAGRVATTVGVSFMAPVVAEALTGAPPEFDSVNSDSYGAVQYAGYVATAADAGLITQEQLKKAAEKYNWVKKDDDGRYRIDIQGAKREDVESLVAWTRELRDIKGGDQTIETIADTLATHYDAGSNAGKRVARSVGG